MQNRERPRPFPENSGWRVSGAPRLAFLTRGQRGLFGAEKKAAGAARLIHYIIDILKTVEGQVTNGGTDPDDEAILRDQKQI